MAVAVSPEYPDGGTSTNVRATMWRSPGSSAESSNKSDSQAEEEVAAGGKSEGEQEPESPKIATESSHSSDSQTEEEVAVFNNMRANRNQSLLKATATNRLRAMDMPRRCLSLSLPFGVSYS